MNKILKVNTPADYSRWLGQPELHPLVSVIDYKEVSPIRHSLNHYNVYGIILRDDDEVIGLTYGCGDYTYKKGTLMCVAPGQIGGKEDNGETVSINGWILLFHPDILHGTALEKRIRQYSFFDYRVNEALHMTEDERDTVIEIMRRLKKETSNPKDECQNPIIAGLIDVLLNYCQRFYNRQFASRNTMNNDILSRFESLLKDYYTDSDLYSKRLPTIQYLADRMCMSANYLGDVIKKMTNETAGSHIRRYVIMEAKNLLAAGTSVSETAYSLGFEYPQHFSRFFKRSEGITPKIYVNSLKRKK